MAIENQKTLQDEILVLQTLRNNLDDNWSSLQEARENASLAQDNLSKFQDIKQLGKEEIELEKESILKLQESMANDEKYLNSLSPTDPSYEKQKEIVTQQAEKDRQLLKDKITALQDPFSFSHRKLQIYKEQIESTEAKIKEIKDQKNPSKDNQEMIDGLRSSIKNLELKTKKHEVLLHFHQRIQNLSIATHEVKSNMDSIDERYKKWPYDKIPESQRTVLKNIENKYLTEKLDALSLTLHCYVNPVKTAVNKDVEKALEAQHTTLTKEVKKEIKVLDTAIQVKEKALSSHKAEEERRILVDDAVLHKTSKPLTTQFNNHRDSHHPVKPPQQIPQIYPQEKHKGYRP